MRQHAKLDPDLPFLAGQSDGTLRTPKLSPGFPPSPATYTAAEQAARPREVSLVSADASGVVRGPMGSHDTERCPCVPCQTYRRLYGSQDVEPVDLDLRALELEAQLDRARAAHERTVDALTADYTRALDGADNAARGLAARVAELQAENTRLTERTALMHWPTSALIAEITDLRQLVAARDARITELADGLAAEWVRVRVAPEAVLAALHTEEPGVHTLTFVDSENKVRAELRVGNEDLAGLFGPELAAELRDGDRNEDDEQILDLMTGEVL